MTRSLNRILGAALLAAPLALAACSDGPSGPPRQVVAALEPAAGASQSGIAGQTLGIHPTVLVSDTRGHPMVGVNVQFVVTRGGGSVESASVYTDGDGLASAGGWKLGTAGQNELEARVGALAPAIFRATAAPPPTPPDTGSTNWTSGGGSAFAIDVRVIGDMSVRQHQAVAAAVQRWQATIVMDLPDARLSAAAATCFPAQPALNQYIDDLLLYVEFVDIDGPSGTLGEAGPCYVRSGSDLPLMGYLKLDRADLLRMETTGTLDDVVLHEIGHILGIGTMWDYKGLIEGKGGEDPRFTGANAIAAYRGMGGLQAAVAVENTGGTGTREGHWRESEFGSELMTGYVGSVPNPLSALTIASLLDLGYGASVLTASQYTLGTTFGRMLASTAALDLRGREKVRKPKFRVHGNGRSEPLPH